MVEPESDPGWHSATAADPGWHSAAVAARMLSGWACLAVAVLNLSMGIDLGSAADRPYLAFHVVLFLGGLVLVGLGHLEQKPNLIGYALTAALAVAGTALAAVPRTSSVCCLHDLAVRHGYPFTALAWNPGGRVRLAPGHLVADLLFWFLAGLILLVPFTPLLRPRPARPEPTRAQQATHAEVRASTELDPDRASDEENVRRLP